ncbi:hypothetical protein STEG23_037166 [Scotinomys teguina]
MWMPGCGVGVSRPPPGAMLLSESHPAAGAIMTRGPKVLPRATCGSIVLKRLQSVLMSVACVNHDNRQTVRRQYTLCTAVGPLLTEVALKSTGKCKILGGGAVKEALVSLEQDDIHESLMSRPTAAAGVGPHSIRYESESGNMRKARNKPPPLCFILKRQGLKGSSSLGASCLVPVP